MRALAFLLLLGAVDSAAVSAQPTHKHVLLLQSFGRNFEPYQEFASGLQKELARLSPEPVEFFEVSIETARFAEANDEAPFVAYLEALTAERKMDLLVTVGGPAARFGIRERDGLFPSVPLLVSGVESRVVGTLGPPNHSTVASFELDLPGVIENILRLLPDTTDVVVVLGGSVLSNIWLEETRREFAPFSDRVRFTWLNDLSLEEMKEKVSTLPEHTVIFFGELSVDAAGVPHQGQSALDALRVAAKTPLFGLFDTQLGHGIVGGPLVSIAEMSASRAAIALRILNGESPESIVPEILTAGAPVYDFRELQRWGIRESRLPPGSTVLFRPPSLWSQYRGPVAIGLGVLGLQTALIGALVLQRSRRRVAEKEARALAHRLLTAHEDERSRLARELHDDLSQRLARLSIDAARVERSIPDSVEKGPARAMRADLARLSEDVHSLSYQLHPSVLDDLGLSEALKVECEHFSRREGIAAQLRSFEVPAELPPEVAVCLFRVAQEALNNVARHSRAHKVSVAVATANGGLKMTVSDDGVGFVPGQRQVRSLGHASMRERARLVGGTLDVESAPGRGTTVNVAVPLREGRA